MNERRSTGRPRTLRGGKIVFNDRRSVIDCKVRNLSDSGARIEVESQLGIPPMFDLQIDGEPSSRSCRRVWQSANKIGISFEIPNSGRNDGGDRTRTRDSSPILKRIISAQ